MVVFVFLYPEIKMSCLRGWVKLKAGCISINSEKDVLNFIVVTLRTKKKKLNIIQLIFG